MNKHIMTAEYRFISFIYFMDKAYSGLAGIKGV